MLMVAQPTGLHHSLEGLERPGDGLTYLQFSGGNCNEVHVVQIGHVNNPHLLVAVLLGLGKLAEQRRLRSWKVASRLHRGHGSFLPHRTLDPVQS